MPEFNKEYTLNSLYIFLIFLAINIYNSNIEIINIILNRIYLMDVLSMIIISNTLGLLVILYKLSLIIEIKISLNYK